MSRDGRRTSDPLNEPNGSPTASPQYQLWAHRTANDTNAPLLAAPKNPKNGINFGGKRKGLVQAIARNGAGLGATPGGTDVVTLTEYEWSPGADAFIATGNTFVAAGAGQPRAFSFDANGRIMYYAVTGLAAGSVSIYVSAFGPDETL